MLEETGYEAGLWQSMGAFKIDGTRGVCTAHLFRAEELRRVATPHTGDMEELEVVFINLNQIAESVRNGEIALLPDLAIIALARSDLFGGSFPEGRTCRTINTIFKCSEARQVRWKPFPGFSVPAIGQGTGGNDLCDEDHRVRLIQQGVDQGLTLIDTAEEYRGGESERVVGRQSEGGGKGSSWPRSSIPTIIDTRM